MIPPSAPTSAASPEFLTSLASAAAWTLPLLPSLLGAAGFATLRVSLQRATPSRVLSQESDERRRARLEPLLAGADSLATSAGVFEVACRAALPVLLLERLSGGAAPTWEAIGLSILIAIPAILLLCDAIPTALALRRGDWILRRTLPSFYVFHIPLRWLVRGFEALRRALLRMAGLEQNPSAVQRIVEGLRDVIEEAEVSGELDATEREIIGNVIETRDASVAQVMTPRTEVFGVDVREELAGAVRVLAECGHSRIPVYDGGPDTILGTISARRVVAAAAEQRLERESLRALIEPAHFVPETKGVRALLAEFRRMRIKMAIVLDEYGGTAGLVTLGDIVQEIVGEISDERDALAPQPIRRLADGSADVDATLRVSEVNEELGTEVPEEADYETLAGFVLSELGHVPRRGEVVRGHGAEFKVLEASDRRILRIGVRRSAPERAPA